MQNIVGGLSAVQFNVDFTVRCDVREFFPLLEIKHPTFFDQLYVSKTQSLTYFAVDTVVNSFMTVVNRSLEILFPGVLHSKF